MSVYYILSIMGGFEEIMVSMFEGEFYVEYIYMLGGKRDNGKK